MNVSIDASLITAIVLVFIRLSALFLLTPIFSVAQLPLRIKLVFLVALSALLVTIVPNSIITPIFSVGGFILAALHELLIGALLAFGLFCAFSAFLLGGRILDFQMGFGVASLIDPATNSQSPLMGTVLNVMAVMSFYMLNGHHFLIRGLVYSLERFPAGQGLSELNITAVVHQFGLMFVYGLMLVAPVIFTLLLLDVGMAVAARTMPQFNMFIIGLPLKIFVGLSILAVSLNYMNPLLQKIYTAIFHYWEEVLV